MIEEDIVTIKGKIISGVVALSTRNILLNIFSFVANFLLTIVLTPAIFGVFFIVSAVISFLSYFSDVGLAAALIQKKQEPSRKELVSVFTLQELLVITIVGIVFFLSPLLSHIYKLSSEGMFLLYALLISFFLSSLKTIPSLLLERKLDFALLAVSQIVETVAYYIVTVILAFMNFGIASFAWGAIVRGIVGVIAIYYISPWKPGIGLSLEPIKELISFGIPFQTNSFLALIKDDLMTLFLGSILPAFQVGYVGWAKKWGESALRAIIDSVIRVTFPAYSRLQNHKEVLGKALEKTIFFLAFFIFPATVVLVFSMQTLIHIIPKYSKWEPAVFAFYLFAAGSIFAAFSSPLVNALNALGKIKTTLVLMVMWTVLTWALVPLFTLKIGYSGVALAALLISSTGFIPIVIMRRYIVFKVWEPMQKPLIATILMSLPLYILIQHAASIYTFALAMILSGSVYLALTWFWMRNQILPYIPKSFKLKP